MPIKPNFYFVFILLFSFILFNPVHAQRFNAGISGGLSTSQVDGDKYVGFHKAGIAFGAFVNTHFNSTLMGQLEICYIEKGSKKTPNYEKGDYTLYILKLNYIEVPVLLKFQIRKFIYETGFSYGKLLKGQEYDDSGPFVSVGPFHSSEFAFNMGVNYQFFERLAMNWRYTRSILPIRDKAVVDAKWGLIGGSYSTVLSFTLKYHFIKDADE